MKINYGIITEEQLNSKRLRTAWEILLMLMILCVLAGEQASELSVIKNVSRNADKDVSGSVLDNSEIITEASEGGGLWEEFERFEEMRLGKIAERPEIPESANEPYIQVNEMQAAVKQNYECTVIQSVPPVEKPSVSVSKISYVTKEETVPVSNISDFIDYSGESDFVKDVQTVTAGKPKIFIEDIEKIEQTPSIEDSEETEQEGSSDSTIKEEETESSDNSGETNSSEKDGADSEDLEETDETGSSEDTEENGQTFFCGGFLCNESGMIIGCPDIFITDGVLCLPSSIECTGVAAGALDSFSSEVYELYIPANIILIEDGALEGLTELFYIQVHPDNPIYKSSNGILDKK